MVEIIISLIIASGTLLFLIAMCRLLLWDDSYMEEGENKIVNRD